MRDGVAATAFRFGPGTCTSFATRGDGGGGGGGGGGGVPGLTIASAKLRPNIITVRAEAKPIPVNYKYGWYGATEM